MVRVSVGVAAYNRPEMLRVALASIAAQTFQDFEVLVIDDASTDSLCAIVSEFDDRFRLIRLEDNRGPAGARLEGFKNVSGDIVMQLDTDNVFFPGALGRAVRLLDGRPEVMGVSGQYVVRHGANDRSFRRIRTRVLTPRAYAKSRRGTFDMVGAVRRSAVDEWIAKDQRYYASEFHLWLTYHLRHDHLLVAEHWGEYRHHSAPRVTSSRDDRRLHDAVIFVREHRRLVGSQSVRPLDRYLVGEWARLVRAQRPEAREAEAWMEERGLSRFRALSLVAFGAVRRRAASVVLRPEGWHRTGRLRHLSDLEHAWRK